MSGESNSEARPEGGDVEPSVAQERSSRTEARLSTARLHLTLAVYERGDALDDFAREALAAVDAIDRARKRLRESMRRATP